MKIDFHTHGKLSKSLPFEKRYIEWMFEECKNSSILDAICLTEHFNTQDFEKFYRYIYDNSKIDGDCLIFKGLKIFPGMEVDILEGAHILVLGKFDHIMDMNKKLENNKAKDSFLSFDELINLSEKYDLIIGAAHPYRSKGAIPRLSRKQLEKFDFIDLNGKDIAIDGQKSIEKVEKFAKEISRPILCGSDTHQSFQYGVVYNIFEKSVNTFKDLKEEIKSARYTLEISDTIEEQVRAASLLKIALKKINSLGGDYIEVLTDNK